MNEFDEVNDSYVEANAARLDLFRIEVEKFLGDDAITVELAPDCEEVVRVDNLFTVEGFNDIEPDVEPEEAERVVTNNNLIIMTTARIHATGLRARINMQEMSKRPKPEEAVSVYPFAQGNTTYKERKLSSDDYSLEVYSTEVADFETVGNVKEVVVAFSDSLVTERIRMVLYDDKVIMAEESKEARQDAVMGQVMKVLGVEGHSMLMLPMAGMFESEEDLDAQLQIIRDRFAGSESSQVDEVLALARERALALKGAHEMRSMFGPDHPDMDALDDVTEALKQLSQ